MRILTNSPHKVFWACIPLVLILSLLGPNSAVDLQNHNTYYVVSSFHISLFLSFKIFILGSIYWLLRKKKLIKMLSKTHIILTIASMTAIILYHLFFRRMLTYSFDIFEIGRSGVPILILIYFFGQMLFIINIIYALIKGRKEE